MIFIRSFHLKYLVAHSWIIPFIHNIIFFYSVLFKRLYPEMPILSGSGKKEGYIRSVHPVDLNPKGEWIEVLDNNFFANPRWKEAIDYLIKAGQMVNFHGVDVRIMNEEQAFYLSKLKLKRRIHIAWDLPDIDLTEKLKEVTKYIKPRNLSCYVLVGFNSTIEQDIYRLNRLKELGISPFVQPYRDFNNDRKPTLYEKDIAQWANKHQIFKSCDFADFSPRKGFKCKYYLKQLE